MSVGSLLLNLSKLESQMGGMKMAIEGSTDFGFKVSIS